MTLQQPSLTALAKQGDLNAIAALMNRSLQPKGIVVRVAYQKGHLRVLLEGQTIPDQQVLAPYVRKGILALQIPGLHTLNVLGRSQGASTPAWSEAFALTAAGTELSPTPRTSAEPVESERQQPDSAEGQLEDDSIVLNRELVHQNKTTSDQEPASVINLDAIATHLNQAMGTEALLFEADLRDRVLNLTAKTNQVLEGGTFAKAVQNLLLPLNLADIELVHLYKQKTNGNAPYKIKEFTLFREPTPTKAAVNDTALSQGEGSAAQDRPRSQFAPSQPTDSQPAKASPSASSQASQTSKLVGLALVALFVVVIIGAIKLLAKPPAATEICQEAAGAPGYCQLAVQMVGEQTLHDLKAAAAPFTPAIEEQGVSHCANASSPEAKRQRPQQKVRYTSSVRKEPIFPGVMMVEMQLKTAPQANVETDVTVFRSVCLLAGDDNRVQLIKNVVLPNDWPQAPYQGKQEWEPMQRSLKVHQILMMLGGGTLFTAIGLFAASAFNFGFQIYTIRGLFQTASILGTLDTLLIVMSGAHLHLFGGVPLTCLALGLTQVWVKDLRVDWASGYGSVALGVFLMIVIRFVLNWLLLGFIFSVL